MVTIVDRVSKFTLMKKVGSKHAEAVTAATITLLRPYLDKTLTIAADNGKEFAGYETMKEQLDADVYFVRPYHSWERGLNENTNGLIGQYFTKGCSFENITDGEVEAVMNKPDHRPRKTLNFKTPHTVITGGSFGKPRSTHSLLCRQTSLYSYKQFQHLIPNFGVIQVLAESTANPELQTDCDFCFQR